MNRKPTTKYDLEDRLIEFAVRIIDTAEALPGTVASKNLGSQIVRSGTSPALNYAEAQSAESKADFVHKMKICLKELRETLVCLKIIQRKGYFKGPKMILKTALERLSAYCQECRNLKVARTGVDLAGSADIRIEDLAEGLHQRLIMARLK
ncbi:MAG: four helix bundle protein [Saprospiraceae bacterium]|nr:four helix bundle protein [Saprospiraceae bacterium]